jgi:multiple RNA-binding domain-containing protein 1
VENAAKAANPPSNSLLKRKRSDVDKSDPKLKEFLEVMLPKSQSKAWTTETLQGQDIEEPPRKMQALELPEAESDGEYEMVPKKSKKESSSPKPTSAIIPEVPAKVIEQVPEVVQADQQEPVKGLDGTDDDWLRSRTSRLLDLVEPADAALLKPTSEIRKAPAPQDEPLPAKKHDPTEENEPAVEAAPEAETLLDNIDPTLDAIQSSGRLFVRNLPYTATEEDLRQHFSSYGALEEVGICLFSFFFFCFMMNIQIGTAYALSM